MAVCFHLPRTTAVACLEAARARRARRISIGAHLPRQAAMLQFALYDETIKLHLKVSYKTESNSHEADGYECSRAAGSFKGFNTSVSVNHARRGGNRVQN